ncbi:hypothetical protein [Actinoplanes sp. M2I2]|uniref:hypothetical protein n=1 Tax=Actinoplanes sp. M2I2 TaxID=1734444 RepID=UPI002021E7E1|nr:hypothetical protein [Actinoplanes sp. M2I2]
MRVISPVLRSFVLGVVSGGRSLTGLTAVALTTAPGDAVAPWTGLTSRKARSLLVAGAIGELIADKLPRVPSRLSPPSLAGRTAAAATAAGLAAVRGGAQPARALLPAVAGAVAGSLVGARWRTWADQRSWPPVAAALLEDTVVVGLAFVAARRD